jgi:thiol:disulfide interchange protein DsbC
MFNCSKTLKNLLRRAGAIATAAVLTAGGMLASVGSAYSAGAEDNIQSALHGARIESIMPAPIPGLFEVISEGRLFYVHESGDYLVTGQIHNVRTRANLTAERLEQLRPAPDLIAWDTIPLEAAIKHGSGERKVAVFSDPNCPWCRRLHNEVLMNLTDVTVYEVMFPVLGRDSMEAAKAILCADDSAAALDAHFKGMQAPVPEASCHRRATDLINQALAFGRQHNIEGTPAILSEDGRINGGYLPMAEFQRFIATTR